MAGLVAPGLDPGATAGLVPATSIALAPCSNARGRRNKLGDPSGRRFETIEIRFRAVNASVAWWFR